MMELPIQSEAEFVSGPDNMVARTADDFCGQGNV